MLQTKLDNVKILDASLKCEYKVYVDSPEEGHKNDQLPVHDDPTTLFSKLVVLMGRFKILSY